jgi:hypothetical protein
VRASQPFPFPFPFPFPNPSPALPYTHANPSRRPCRAT